MYSLLPLQNDFRKAFLESVHSSLMLVEQESSLGILHWNQVHFDLSFSATQ